MSYLTNKINTIQEQQSGSALTALEMRYTNDLASQNGDNIKELLRAAAILEANQNELKQVLIEYKKDQKQGAIEWRDFLEKYGPGLQYANRKAQESYGP